MSRVAWRVPWHADEEAALAESWRAATPFRHLVIDDVLADGALAALFELLDEESVVRYVADLYTFEATAPKPETEAFVEMTADFARVLAPALARVTGLSVTRADLRAYAYRDGDYLLPHTDHQVELARVIAYAYYLPSPEPPRGGELELYRMHEGGADRVHLIEPRANRIVLFEVSEHSLHQVREVLGGARLSLAGWFYA